MPSLINASSSSTTGIINTADSSGELTLQTNGLDALVLAAGRVINPAVTNYTETVFTANSGTAITLALTNGTFQIVTLTGNATITMPTAAAGKSFILMLRQDATGSRSVTWSTVNWAGSVTPTITGTASRQDMYSFFSDGTRWYGVTVGQNYTQ
jgi:hypothetical protein